MATKCPFCKGAVEDNNLFCPGCGGKVNHPGAAAQNKDQLQYHQPLKNQPYGVHFAAPPPPPQAKPAAQPPAQQQGAYVYSPQGGQGPVPYNTAPAPKEGKSYVLPFVLSIFFGGFGLHQFFTRHKGQAITRLILFAAAITLFIVGFAKLGLFDILKDPSNIDQLVEVIMDAFSGGSMFLVYGGMVAVSALLLSILGIWAFVDFIILLVYVCKGKRVPEKK